MHLLTIFIILIILGLSFYVSRISGFEPEACIQCRESHVCYPPDCFCCRDQMPMETHSIPQMVFFSFDDAVTPQVAVYYRQLFDSSRKNPNGCPISMTLFVSDKNTVYDLVREFYDKGMEIASHSVTHSHPSSITFAQEAKKQKENLAKNAGIPETKITGWRSPFLEPLGDTQPSVLKKLGYEYDATLTVVKDHNDTAITPFTLDFGWPYDCKIKPCPSLSHKGFWEVPVVSVKDYLDKYDCVYVDGCNNPPPTEDMAYKFLYDNFNKYYKTNRAPMGLNMHASWFYYPERKAAMNRFIKALVKMDDVYIISIKQVIEWLKKPTPLYLVNDFPPWQCRGDNGSIKNLEKTTFHWHQQRIHNSLIKSGMAKDGEKKQFQDSIDHQQYVQFQIPNAVYINGSSNQTLLTTKPIVQRSMALPQTWLWQQRHQILPPSHTSNTVPPMVPNLPMVRFWWNSPESMNPPMPNDVQKQRDLSIYQEQRQEIRQRGSVKEERQRQNESHTQADAHGKLFQQYNENPIKQQQFLRPVEQNRIIVSSRTRTDAQSRQEIIHLAEVKLLQETQKQMTFKTIKELQRAANSKLNYLNHQKTEMSAQDEQERQKQIQHLHNKERFRISQQSHDNFPKVKKVREAIQVQQNSVSATVNFLNNMSRTENEIYRQPSRFEPSLESHMHPAGDALFQKQISNTLDMMLQFPQNERYNHLETLSLYELKAIQQELKRRLIVELSGNESNAEIMPLMPIATDNGDNVEFKTKTSKHEMIIAKDITTKTMETVTKVGMGTTISTEKEEIIGKFDVTNAIFTTTITTTVTPTEENLYLNASKTSSDAFEIATVTPLVKDAAYDLPANFTTHILPLENLTLTTSVSIYNKSMWNIADIDQIRFPWKHWSINSTRDMQQNESEFANTSFPQDQPTRKTIGYYGNRTTNNSKLLFPQESLQSTLLVAKESSMEPVKHIIKIDTRHPVLKTVSVNGKKPIVPVKYAHSKNIFDLDTFIPESNTRFINMFRNISLPKNIYTKPNGKITTDKTATKLHTTIAKDTLTIGTTLLTAIPTARTTTILRMSPTSQYVTSDTTSDAEIRNTNTETPTLVSTMVTSSASTPVSITATTSEMPPTAARVTLQSSVSDFAYIPQTEQSSGYLGHTHNTTVSHTISHVTNQRQAIRFSTQDVIYSSTATAMVFRKAYASSTFPISLLNLPQWTRSPETHDSKQNLKSQCVQGSNCIAPNCVCSSDAVPFGLKVQDIPQIVYITVDGSLNFHSFSKLNSLFSPTRRNPNGCRIKGTVFVTDSGSSYRVSQALHNEGIEIALMGSNSRPHENATSLLNDVLKQRKRIATESNFPERDIIGWRSPGLKPVGDEQYAILSNNSLYDSSLITNRSVKDLPKLWPHTLDFGWNEPCIAGNCPTEVHPGVWEIPVIPLVGPQNSTACVYTDGCTQQPETEEETMQYLMENFKYYYEINRAPFGIRLKQTWFHMFYHENLSALVKFLDKILTFGDVYVTSVASVIDWIKTPITLKDIKQFQTWKC